MSLVWMFATLMGWFAVANNASLHHNVAPNMRQCKELHNGCSVHRLGLSISANLEKYTEVFEPACLKHDICYACGQYNNWDRNSCDKGFLGNMRMICHLRHNTKRYSWLERVGIGMQLGYDMTAWLNIPGDTLQHCLHGASIFYKGVDGFGEEWYGGEYQAQCQKCAQLGNPTRK